MKSNKSEIKSIKELPVKFKNVLNKLFYTIVLVFCASNVCSAQYINNVMYSFDSYSDELGCGEATANNIGVENFGGLKSIKFNDNIKGIVNCAFDSSSHSGQFTIPESWETISYAAFRDCHNLSGSLFIPDNIKNIGFEAFKNCKNICGNLILGKGLEIINGNAFENIGEINSVVIKAMIPPTGSRFPDEIYENATLYVPVGTLELYSKANLWRDFSKIVELEYQDPEKLEVSVGKRTLSLDLNDKSSFYSDYSEIVMEKGSKLPLKSIVTPSNLINDNVDWEVTDTIAYRIKDGYLEMKEHSVNYNKNYLKVSTCNNIYVRFPIYEGIPTTSIELPDTIIAELGRSNVIDYSRLPDRSLGDISWEIVDSSIAEFSDGYIMGKSLGYTTLKATVLNGWGGSYECVLKVVPPFPTEVKLNKNSVTYGINSSRDPLQLSAKVYPTNYMLNIMTSQDVIWTSSNEKIATVDDNGLVTFQGFGKVTIRAAAAEDISIYDECEISLEYEAYVTLNGHSALWGTFLIYRDEENNKFELTTRPGTVPITDIIFTSEDENVLSTEPNGTATWKSPGHATIYCTYTLYGKNYSISKSVYCEPAKYVTALSFKEPSLEVNYNDQFKLDLSNLDIVPEDATKTGIEWSVLDESIIKITKDSSNEAEFKALNLGETDIIATTIYGEVKAACHVAVTPAPIEYISLSRGDIYMTVGETDTVTAYCYPSYSTIKTLIWTCDPTIAIIKEISDDTISIEAVGIGETDLIASANEGEASATLKLRVYPANVKEIYLNESHLSGCIGDEFQLEVSFSPSYATNKEIEWSSSDSNIVSVDDSGKITLKNIGQARIYARSLENSDKLAWCLVDVKELHIPVQEIYFDESSISGNIGDELKLEVFIYPEEATNKEIDWRSNNPDIVSVNDSGITILHKAGKAIISAISQEDPNIVAYCEIKVNEESSVQGVIDDKQSFVRIFTIDGVLIYKGVYSEANLLPGFYTICVGNKSYKIAI